MEKFALLNLLKALQSLSPQNQSQTESGETPPQPTEKPPVPPAETVSVRQSPYPNVMASVIERHEAISNRLKNKR